jgi:WhiB family redox-sensing transcriptional regulator
MSRRDIPTPLLRTAGTAQFSDALGKREDWMAYAVCASVDPDLWFPEHGRTDISRKARRICADCPVRAECEAFGQSERWGIWGGVSSESRRRHKGAA